MNKEIIKDINIYMGIDTLQIQSKCESLLNNEQAPYINKIVTLDSENGKYSYRLNPDKANNNLMIYNNTDFESVLSLMIFEMNLNMPKLTRIDFRIDSFDDNFTQLLKLNRLVIMIMSQNYKLKNRYFSEDFLTLDELTIRAQNHRLEIENYNKAVEEPTGEVRNRLELRSKNLELNAEQTELIKKEWYKWVARMKKKLTKDNFLAIQKTANHYLKIKYYREKQQGKNFTLNEFLYKYNCNIFTRKQLVQFVKSVEPTKNAEHFATNYKKRKKIEYFSFKDLQLYLNKIVQAGQNFFEKA